MRGLSKVERKQGGMKLTEQKKPSIKQNEVLVEVDYAGLCGSDAGIYKFKTAFERMELPTVIGHEYTGVVTEQGSNVTDFKIGDRVIERPIRYCGACYQCKIGEKNICQNSIATGIDIDGAYRQYIAVPERSLHHIPDGMPARHAAVVEPTSICARAVIRNSRVGPGDRVLVEGPGPIGLITAQIAAIQGAKVVVSGVGTDESYRLPLAEELGLQAVNIGTEDLDRIRSEITDDIGFDVVFDATGHPSGLETAIEQVRSGGQIVLVGQTGETTVNYTPLVRSEIDIQCSYTSVYQDYERAVRIINSGKIDHEMLIDDKYSLLESDAAFQAFLQGETCKPVFDVTEIWD